MLMHFIGRTAHLTSSACVADPYENGTPSWGDGGTPEDLAKTGNPLRCSFDDSVDWLRRQQRKRLAAAGRATSSGAAAAASLDGGHPERKWCPFTESKKASGGTTEQVSSSK
jgi:hypothetical protein